VSRDPVLRDAHDILLVKGGLSQGRRDLKQQVSMMARLQWFKEMTDSFERVVARLIRSPAYTDGDDPNGSQCDQQTGERCELLPFSA